MKPVPFFSRRNQVCPVLFQGRAAVEKHFSRTEDWNRERALYAALADRLLLPAVLAAQPGVLVLEYKNAPTLLSELERQERAGFDPVPWHNLVSWLRQCRRLCGQLPREGNLRNFLWDSRARRIIGLDLEDYAPDDIAQCGARLAAATLAYAPSETDVKRRAAAVLTSALSVPDALLEQARQALAAYRLERPHRPLSGIVLAGGASRRMGRSKAELLLEGKPLLHRQVDKLLALGVEDVMLSGANCPDLPGTRVIPDEFPGTGPLAGLHACLKAARNPACLVLSVDVPLVPAATLAHLCRAHETGVTVLRRGEWEEPLIGVYDRTVSDQIAEMLKRGERAVRALKRTVRWQCFDYWGPEELLMNCNTPEDFARAKELARAYADAGFAL